MSELDAAAAAAASAGSTGDGYAFISKVETKSKEPKTILHPMQMDFPEGMVTAILGPSGSGKTTLLNVVTDTLQSNVRAVGEVSLPGASAFIPQDDRLHGFYTCRAYLKHYSRLSGYPDAHSHIDELLQKLGLTDQADTIVGDVFLKGLSGGQKRRLSIALEALTDPENFFLDEPTSGLDAESAYQVMQFLHDYARDSPGRHVILTIHQPSSFLWQLIDHVVLLSKGKLMYQGPREKMESFFSGAGYPTPEHWNMADHYVTVVNDEFRLSGHTVDEWSRQFESWHNQQARRVSTGLKKRTPSLLALQGKEKKSTKRSSSPLVVAELTYRYFLNLWFNPGILATRIAMYVMLALMVGALFWDLGNRDDFASIQSRTAVLFYCVAFFIFMSVAVMPFTVIERAIVDKEVLNGYYNPIWYQFSQGLSSVPGAALLAFLTTVIIIPMTKLNEPMWYFLNMFLSLVCAEALAQMVSHVAPHFVIGMALVAGMYGFFMLCQGFMLIPGDFPNWLRWTYNVAFHTYSWRTFMYKEFSGETFDSLEFQTGEQVLETFEIEDVHPGNDMLVLACYAIIIHIFSFIILHFKYTLFKGTMEMATEDMSTTPPKEETAAKAPEPVVEVDNENQGEVAS